MNRILIVDDVEINRDILRGILEDEYEIVEADNGIKALEEIRKSGSDYSAVLLDLVMPKMNGMEVVQKMRDENIISRIPVLVISAEDAVESEKMCFEMGVTDYIVKPFNVAIIKRRIRNMVDLYNYRNSLEKLVELQTERICKQYELVNKQARKLEKKNIQLNEQAKKLEISTRKIIEILGSVVESRDLESGEHILRVREYTRVLSKKMMDLYPEYGITKHKVDVISSASALHDIGKISIPDSILLKPGKLTTEEFNIMKTHTTLGCKFIENVHDIWDDEYDEICRDICKHHHERFDGSGYPDGLIADEIPITAQIVSIADVYDALISPRVYKKAYTTEEAYNMIINGECGVFSPKLIKCLECCRTEFEKIAGKY